MNENEHYSLTDDELHDVFEGESTRVPINVAKNVTPWKKAMQNLLVGFGISAASISYFPLDFIFSAIGSVLVFFGFRSLRKENRAFKVGCGISVLFLIYTFAIYVFEACAVFGEFSETTAAAMIKYCFIFLRLVELIAIVKGVGSVQKKAGLEGKNKGWKLVFWYGLMCLFALFNYTGILVYVLIIAYIIMIVRLYKFYSSLDNAGFAIRPAKIHIGSKAFSITAAVLLIVSIITANVFFGSYPMKFNIRTDETSKSVALVKTKLASLGFPKDVLDDLSNEEILDCKNAKEVHFEKSSSPISDGIVYNNGKEIKSADAIEFTTVVILVSGNIIDRKTYKPNKSGSHEQQEWKIIHYFRLLPTKKSSKTECIEIMPAYIYYNTWWKAKDTTGKLFFEKDGKSYVGDYYSIGKGIKRQDAFSSLFGDSQSENIYADFSVPKGSENFRGYLSYSVCGNIGELMLDSYVTFYSCYSFPTYPATTAKEYALGKNSSLFTMFWEQTPRAIDGITY